MHYTNTNNPIDFPKSRKEHIKDLMNLAGTDTSGKWMSVDNASTFAELIVRECANIARNNTRTDSKVNQMILKHFNLTEEYELTTHEEQAIFDKNRNYPL